MPIQDNRPGSGGGGGSVDSVNGQSGNVVLTKTNIGLGNVDNTSDLNKPVSTAQQAALDDKIGLNDPPADIEPDANSGFFYFSSLNSNVKPLQASPNETWAHRRWEMKIDPDSANLPMGTSGQFAYMLSMYLEHLGNSDIGSLSLISPYVNLGNGVDAIAIGGLRLFDGYGDINADVTLDNIQGYSFQFNVDAAASITSYINAFQDFAQLPGAVPNYYSFIASPNIGEVKNNNNLTGLLVNPTVGDFIGNAGFNGIQVNGTFGDFDTGSFNGVYVAPTINTVQNAYGLLIDMTNVTAVNKYAAQFTGDVNITGDLSFTGTLSIGSINAYGEQNPIVDGGLNPSTIHGLINSMVAPDNVTIANVDTIGVNTASLINIGENAILTSGPFSLGLTSLAFPAIVTTKSGSSLDFLTGAGFAINFDAASTGGTIGQVTGARAIFVPNGVTSVTRAYGFWFHTPFGAISADTWGLYIEDATKNYMEGALKIGAGSDEPTAGITLDVEGDVLITGDLQVTGTIGNPPAQVDCDDNDTERVVIGDDVDVKYTIDYVLQLNVSGKKITGSIILGYDSDEAALLFDEEREFVNVDLPVVITPFEDSGDIGLDVELDTVGENAKFRYTIRRITAVV